MPRSLVIEVTPIGVAEVMCKLRGSPTTLRSRALRPIDPIRAARESHHEVKKEWGAERGASVLEYTILVSLVVLMVVGAMTALGRQIDRTLPEGMPAATTAAQATTTSCPSATTTTTNPPPGTTTTTTPPTGC
jgi:Flp pilus assembly pilin Flp